MSVRRDRLARLLLLTVTLVLASCTGSTEVCPPSDALCGGTGVVVPQLSIADVTVTEGDAGTVNAVFTVTQSAATTQTVTVNYTTADGTAVAPDDYVTKTGSLTFNAGGALTQTVTVLVNGDLIDEGASETFTVALSTPTNGTIGDGSATGTITDDDVEVVPEVSIADVTVTEGDAGTVDAVFTVTLSTISGRTVTVDYATADGTAVAPGDYAASTGTLTFDPGTTTRVVTVVVNGDLIDEGASETFTVGLSMPSNATIGDGSATGTINDDDGAIVIVPQLSIADVTVVEGDAGTVAAVFTVTLFPTSGDTVTVDYATADGTALEPGDYTSVTGLLGFSPGATTRDVTVLVNGDLIDEGTSETFTVELSMPTGATIGDGSAKGTITDDDGGCALLGPLVVGTVGAGRLEAGDCQFPTQQYYDAWALTVATPSTLQIDLASGDFDAFMRLEDAKGMLLGADDDSGGGLPDGSNSRIVVALSAGTYTILASSWGAGETGSYTLTVGVPAPVTAPLISNLSMVLVLANDPACSIIGSSFDVSFDFTDADGDVGGFWFVNAAYFFQPSGDFDFFDPDDFNPVSSTGTPSSGTVFWTTCYAFNANTTLDYTVTLTDDSGLTSNSLAIRLPKPAGAPTSASPSSVSSMRRPGG